MIDSYLREVLVGFGPNTLIHTLFDGPKLFKDIKLGDNLKNSHVIGILKFINTGKIYNFKNGIYLHENYKYNNIKIKDDPGAVLTTHKPEFIYNIITTTGRLSVKNLILNDFSISTNISYNHTINSLKLSFLNKTIESINVSYGSKFLAQGFSGETLVTISPNIQKKMKSLKINELINDNDSIIGIIELSSYFFTSYKYNDTVISTNTKIYKDGVWKSVEYAMCPRMPPPLQLINIITDKGMLMCNGDVFMDFLEVRNEFIKKRIDEIIYASILDT